MAQFISNTPQTLTAGEAVALQYNAINGGCSIMHREGSPLVSLKGTGCCKCPTYYKVSAHVVVTGATTPIELALAEDGIVIPETTIALPAVTAGTAISGTTDYIVPADCKCTKLSIIAVTDATVESAVLIVNKVVC